jgi:uncharacterized membrane protein YqjE
MDMKAELEKDARFFRMWFLVFRMWFLVYGVFALVSLPILIWIIIDSIKHF